MQEGPLQVELTNYEYRERHLGRSIQGKLPRHQEARLEITLRVVVRFAQQIERLLGVISTRVHH